MEGSVNTIHWWNVMGLLAAISCGLIAYGVHRRIVMMFDIGILMLVAIAGFVGGKLL